MSAARIGLSTASVYPESTAHAFAYAAQLGYDAVEVMVGIDALSQQISAVKQLSEHHEHPGLARSTRRACCSPSGSGAPSPGASSSARPRWPQAVGAEVVVVHPPFRWQKEYAARLRRRHRGARGVDRHRLRRREHVPVAGLARGAAWRCTCPAGTPPRSPTPTPPSTSRTPRSRSSDADRDGRAARATRLRHIHLTDGTGSAKDEHLVPGRGAMGAAGFLRPPRRDRLRRPHRAGDQHPQVRATREEREATCASRWSSPASTSRSGRR